MRSILLFILLLGGLFIHQAKAQLNLPSEIHLSGNSRIDQEISLLLNELELKDEQKIVIAILLLKYVAEFDQEEFEDATTLKQLSIAQQAIKKMDKDFKVILDKRQFKVYKKHKKAIKKEIKKLSRE